MGRIHTLILGAKVSRERPGTTGRTSLAQRRIAVP
jgi:hypothetical protein